MKLSLKSLNDRSAWVEAGVALPDYDVASLHQETTANPRWIHFGAGNIFRIFIGGVADSLIAEGEMSAGITCVETFDFDIIDKIYKPHDNLTLGVTLQADGGTQKRVIGSLGEALTTRDDMQRLREIAADPDLQLFSFTITEKGYSLRGSDGEFFPYIKEDLEKGPAAAQSAMAVVTALLYERYQQDGHPLAVVSMDNCAHNGDVLKNAIMTMAQAWGGNGFVDEGFIDYLTDETKITFPWTMIDKITPRPAESVTDELTKLGIEGMALIVTDKHTYIAPFVNAEGPQYLVIEDHFPNGRPAFDKAGVYLTQRETVDKVERMKVTTCLNPLHTALAVYGCLLDYNLISAEMKDPELKALVEAIGPGEGMAVVTHPGILDPLDFVKEVIEVRLPNPFMPDAPQRIATDTSQKVGIRFGETIKAYVEKYGDAKQLTAIPLAIAGWLRYLLGVDDNGKAFECSPDPLLAELQAQLAGIEVGKPASYTGQAREILANEKIFGSDLYAAGIGAKIEAILVEEIAGPGAVRSTLKKYLSKP